MQKRRHVTKRCKFCYHSTSDNNNRQCLAAVMRIGKATRCPGDQKVWISASENDPCTWQALRLQPYATAYDQNAAAGGHVRLMPNQFWTRFGSGAPTAPRFGGFQSWKLHYQSSLETAAAAVNVLHSVLNPGNLQYKLKRGNSERLWSQMLLPEAGSNLHGKMLTVYLALPNTRWTAARVHAEGLPAAAIDRGYDPEALGRELLVLLNQLQAALTAANVVPGPHAPHDCSIAGFPGFGIRYGKKAAGFSMIKLDAATGMCLRAPSQGGGGIVECPDHAHIIAPAPSFLHLDSTYDKRKLAGHCNQDFHARLPIIAGHAVIQPP